MIEELINQVITNPTEKSKQDYLNFVNQTEYNLLVEAESYPNKSQEHFNKRREAFTYRRNSAMSLITQWVKQYKTSEGCPVSYADTLIIPFQKITSPT
jgi:hypothetical protein